jgi:hypothetical protein
MSCRGIFQTVEEAIQFVTDRPSPLAFYVFTSNEAFKQKGRTLASLKSNDLLTIISVIVMNETASGSFVLNDTFWQLAGQCSSFKSIFPQ